MAITVNTEPDEWAGVFNEILVEFQRKDFVVTSINGTDLVLTAPGSADLDADDYIYLYGDAGAGNTDSGFFTIATKASNTVFTISAAFGDGVSAYAGYLNSDDVRSDYYLALLAEDTVYLKIVPDPTGLCSADISENLIYLLTAANYSDYVTKYSQDTYLGASYDLEYTEDYRNGLRDGRLTSLEQSVHEISQDFKKLKVMIYMLYGAIALVQFLPDLKNITHAVP